MELAGAYQSSRGVVVSTTCPGSKHSAHHFGSLRVETAEGVGCGVAVSTGAGRLKTRMEAERPSLENQFPSLLYISLSQRIHVWNIYLH